MVVGLGGIGGGMARRLADCDRDVVGLDVDALRAGAWSASSGTPAVSVFEDIDWQTVRCVVIAVRTAPQVESVLSRPEVSSVLVDGASVFIVTTMTPSAARAVIGGGPAGLRLFELPVSGGEVKAAQGELTGLLAGPEPDEFERDLLRDLFARTFTLDAVGQPSLLKLINNGLATHNALAAAVALATAHEGGIDASVACSVIRTSSGSSVIGDGLAVLSDNQVDLLVKDLQLLSDELMGSPFADMSVDEIKPRVVAARALLSATSEGDQL
ncbi:NAD(P)-binding domain-containing protein [Pseudonocardia kujensis]|uniref:NAD(P)-binding domain-containing protein n=1 Tax=Pseudonocardia kujensis TaxID=1128675 RepID=UPI001E493529|nr:NAD(P)-binding domain-containing protein [Pseudonocardia kujensis]MCE0765075.1 NAD(P)-binding domain-containing protein [Pseudonocardia kujensis]